MGGTITQLPDPDHSGLGAFVTLDYTTINKTGRFEHAILLLPQTRDSMYELIRAPGVFVEAFRGRYKSTPKHYHNVMASKWWQFAKPITISIEPLTIPSPSNAMTLSALSTLYPGFAAIADNWKVTTPSEFLSQVLEASRPASGGVSIGYKECKAWPSQGALSPKNPFPLQYVAEFALKTRTITIKYVPDSTRSSKWQFNYPITLSTINPVQNTNLTFLHFDADFGNGSNHTYASVADARAKFALDYITDPSFIDGLTKPTYVDSHGNSVGDGMISKAPFIYNVDQNILPASGPVQHTVPFVRGDGITIKGTTYYQPTLLIDSVWPDPATVPASEPVPPICYLLSGGPVVEYPVGSGEFYFVTSHGLVKAYSTPTTKWSQNVTDLNVAIAQLEFLKDEIKEVGPILDASRALKAKLDKSKKQ